ncbi:uncharacterized protein LOC116429511 [Nomia melanderi]|uniref:uncharacterized protein LOC116429511 n=1 Tax=Nomia melanderi TaxID=2448451 RepID=UPI003FCED9D3
MTSQCAEDDEDSSSIDSTDQSEPEIEEDEPNYRDIRMNKNEDNFNVSLRLSKFFEDVEKSRKYSLPATGNDIRDGIRFEEKMYRVIPIKLDEKIPELRKLINSN